MTRRPWIPAALELVLAGACERGAADPAEVGRSVDPSVESAAAAPTAPATGADREIPGSDDLERLARQIAELPPGPNRSELLVTYLVAALADGQPGAAVDDALVGQALSEVGATDPAWEVHPGVLVELLPHVEDMEPFLETMSRDHASTDVRAAALLALATAARRQGREETVKALTARAVETAPDSGYTATLRGLDPGGPIQVGKPVPDFELTLVSDGGRTVSAGSLRGTTYLVLFWATWCQNCPAEMAALAPLYERFHPRGFEVYAISIDEERSALTGHRGAAYPWPQAWHAPETTTALRDKFEALGVPTAVLVGPEGTVVADGLGASVAGLEEVLPKLLPG